MRVLFYEPNSSGHHFSYLARMLPGFLELPVQVALATTETALQSQEFAATLAPLTQRYSIELLTTCRPLLKQQAVTNAYRRVRDLLHTIDIWKPHHVCICYADGMWELLTLRHLLGQKLPRGIQYEAWLFRGAFSYHSAHSLAARAKRGLLRRMLARGVFARINLQDELLWQYCRGVDQGRTVCDLSPDPVDVRPMVATNDARQAANLPADRPIVACLGLVSQRKGVDLAIAAMRRLWHADPLAARLLLAGPHDAPIKSLLATAETASDLAAGRIISIDRFLCDHEMLEMAQASDLVLAPYPNHSGRSSIILWGAAAGRPVVGVNRGCIGYVIEHEQLGWTCQVTQSQPFADAITQALQYDWTPDDAQRVHAYAQWHSIANYQHLSAGLVRARLAAN